jgi:capsular exopolysaccharide synthesis family protein
MNQPESTQPFSSPLKEDEIDLTNLIKISLRKWYWYLLCLFIAGSLAWISISTTNPVYQSSAQVLIKQNNIEFSSIPGLAEVKGNVSIEIGKGSDYEYYITNQMVILTSRLLIAKAIDELNYEVSYFKVINHKDVESYKSIPFSLNWDNNHPQMADVEFNLEIPGNGPLNIRAKSETGRVYDYKNQKVLQTEEKINLDTKVNPGEKISGENYSFTILLNENNKRKDSENFKFVFSTKESLVEKYKENLSVERKNKESSIVSISVLDDIGNKGADFLNKLIEIYLRDNLNEITNESSNSKVLEAAITNGPLYLKTRKSYIIALFLGLIIPFFVISLRHFFHKKIISTADIESVSRVPIAGHLFLNKIKEDTPKLVLIKPESHAAGQFHILRNKLSMLTMGNDHPAIAVTSVTKGEGKSFVSMNLALSYALAKKKTVLLDLDFWDSTGFTNNTPKPGVMDFLSGKSSLDEIISGSQHTFLHLIPSGRIATDPGAILTDSGLKNLLEELKKRYEFVIIDALSVKYFSELYQIVSDLDFTLIVARHGVTNKQWLGNGLEELKSFKLKGIGIVINAIPLKKDALSDYGLQQV